MRLYLLLLCLDVIKNMYDVLPNSGLLPLVSERVISLLLPKFGDSFQFFSADVWNKGVNITGYYIINITKTLHIMDLKNQNIVQWNRWDILGKY